jgi:hypothetical protein
MGLALSILAGLLVIAQLDAAGPGGDSAFKRIRPLQKDGARILAVGIERSPTFRRLVDRLAASNVIVYVDLRPDMRPNHGGSLRFLARSATDLFLKIHLNRAFNSQTQVALLGHELQHAVEVADSHGVNSVADLRDLYRRVGERTGIDQFDTLAARQVGYVVRHELGGGKTSNLHFARADEALLPNMEDFGGETESDRPDIGNVPISGPAGTTKADSELVRQ